MNYSAPHRKLVCIKLLHTAIWVFYNVVLFYLFFAVVTNRIDHWVWICIGLVLLEGLVLYIFKTICPITLIARKYSKSHQDNFDIYLPLWLARYNKRIYTTFFLVSISILVYRLVVAG